MRWNPRSQRTCSKVCGLLRLWQQWDHLDDQHRSSGTDRGSVRETQLWLHVDAAYAGAAAILPEMRYILEGCDRADSFVVNPHKWLLTPMDLSAFYCRRPEMLRRAFSLTPEYLKTAEGDSVTNTWTIRLQLGHRVSRTEVLDGRPALRC